MPVSESPTRSPDTTGGQEVVLLLATQVGVVLAGVATQSLTAYILLPEGRGAYAVCLLFGFLFGALFTPGADRGAQYFVMAGRTSVSQGVSIASAICVAGAGLGVAAAIPLIHSDVAFFQKADTRSFYFALSLVPLTACSTSLHLQLAGLRRFAKLALFSLLQAMTNVVMISVLVWGLDLGVDGAVASVALGHAVFIGACISDLRRSCGLVPELPRRADVARVLGYGWKGYVARTGAMLDERVGILFLGMLASRADIGIFAVGIALMTRFTMIPNSVVPSIMPRIARDAEGRPDLVTLSTRGVYWATGAALAGLLAISTSAREGAAVRGVPPPVVPILWVLAPGVLALSGSLVMMAYFNSVNRPDVCSWATGVGLSANVGSLVILYPLLGFEAAAWAMTIGFVSRSIFLLFMYRRAARVSLASLWLPQRGDATRLRDLARGILGPVRREAVCGCLTPAPPRRIRGPGDRP